MIKIIIVITIIILWAGAAEAAQAVVKRAGNIEVITDEPLFSDSIIWYPGLAVAKSFQVKNRGRGVKTLQIETENETETKQLAGILAVRINSESKTLRNFFDAAGISLGEIFPNDSGEVFSVAISMPVAAGNEYQGGRAKFDLRIGFLGESQSSVTVAGGGEGRPASADSAFVATSAKEAATAGEEGEGLEGGGGPEGQEGEGQALGEATGVTKEEIDWRLLGIIGGLLVSGGLLGWMWWRRNA